MGYRLNCGIELTDCEPGDSFISEGHPDKLLYCGGRTYFDIEGQSKYMICQDGKEWLISRLTPTEETKRKVEARRIHAAGFTDIEHTESGAIKCRQAGREYLIPNKPMKIKEDKLDIPEFKLFGWTSKQAYDDHIAGLFGKHHEIPADRMKYPADEVEAMLKSFSNIGDRNTQDVPEIIPPLARIVDWEKEQPLESDIVFCQEFGWAQDYRNFVDDGSELRDGLTVIRINTAAIPKQQAMTKAEVEREFGVKVVD